MKKVYCPVRIGLDTDMQVQELSEMLGVSRSEIIRVLLKNSINQLQDENGNWKLSGKVHQLAQAETESKQAYNDYT